MALALRLPILIVIIVFTSTNLPQFSTTALAAGLDANDKATLKDATRLYKQGQYEEAAKLLTKLAVDNPEMANLQRNLGACYYYLGRPEPALSNLRDYLAHKKNDIGAEDKAEVERWIDEMEKLRAQNATAATARTAAESPPVHVEGGATSPPVTAPVTSPSPETASTTPRPAQVPAPQSPAADSVTLPQPAPMPSVQPSPTVLQQAHLQAPVQDSVASATQPVDPGSRGIGLRTAGAACGVLGLASIGMAVYYYTRATSLSDKVTNSNPAASSDFQAGKDAETMQWVFYSIGAGAVVTGLVLYTLGWNASTERARVSVVPTVAPGIAGLSAHGVF
jgi:tetratricopeptide (TPR) repeat protein